MAVRLSLHASYAPVIVPRGCRPASSVTRSQGGRVSSRVLARTTAIRGAATALVLGVAVAPGVAGQAWAAPAPSWATRASAAQAVSTTAAPAVNPDYDGDGDADLAMGRPSTTDGGMVYVAFGDGSAQSISGTDLDPKADAVGTVLASCDVNGDGFSDLVLGDSYHEVASGLEGSGAVYVVLGSAAGLDPDTAQTFTQDTPGVPGQAEEDDWFGAAVGCGNLDSDPYADVVIASPMEALGSVAGAGTVTVLRGSASGATTTGLVEFSQNTPGVPGGAETSDLFGSAIAIGDLNRDGRSELAVGSLGENGLNGAVHVFAGTATGPNLSSAVMIDGNSVGIKGTAMFGGALAMGDVNRDGVADLLVGAPAKGSGRVALLTGKAGEPVSSARRKVISQASSGVPGTAESGDMFGATLVAGDVDGDGDADVVIGSPDEALGAKKSAGAVTLMRGGKSPLTSGVAFTQDTKGVPGASEAGDGFGYALALVDLSGDGRLDVAVGTPFEALGGQKAQGMVQVFRGTSTGLSFNDVLGLTSVSFGDAYGSGALLGAGLASRWSKN